MAGNSIAYLDGQFTATRLQPGSAVGCKFVNDTDYNHGEQSEGSSPAANHSVCCQLCEERAGCAAGVFSQNTCWYKSQSDISKPSYFRGAVGCVVQRDPGHMVKLTNASVPGDIISDLEREGLIGDPWFEMNFKNATLWTNVVWNYTTPVELSEEDVSRIKGYSTSGSDVVLVFDGIKMGARILLNDHVLGIATDQFVRYNFSLGSALASREDTSFDIQVGSNTLVVSFDSEIDTEGRFMACTGGWDWAPYSTTSGPGYKTFSRGIWKSVYLVTIDGGGALIEHVVPQIFYTGEYPTAPLQPQQHSDFKVDVIVKFYVPQASEGVLSVKGEWGASVEKKILLAAGSGVSETLTLSAAAENISLWWPLGLGNQTLYNLTVTYTPAAVNNNVQSPVQTSRMVGFRYVALVTGNDTDPEYIKNASSSETTSSFGMYFRVNGAAVFNRGANMIPMEELEGRMSAEAHAQLVKNAALGRMNMLRVWGGGIYLPDIWYDECDRQGIMVYHDMMYAQQGHSPQDTAVQDAELRHQIRRLAHHPSIVVWDGCNECRVTMNSRTAIYATFVLRVVVEEDKSRPVWPSCPAIGWKAGVHALDATPTGAPLETLISHHRYTIETHGPYLIGNGFETVNSGPKLTLFSSGIPLQISETKSGVDQPNVFASEFGTSVFSSFESMSPSLQSDHWGVHAGMPAETCDKTTCTGTNPMSERNHPCDAVIEVYFGGVENLDAVGEQAFKKQLYQCMVGQALNMKSTIEARRATNQFGIIVWQYNEIWPTGGWGSIEYGTPRPGQVIGGRWKPLHHVYRQSLFTDVIIACGKGGLCYIKSDLVTILHAKATVTAITITDGAEKVLYSQAVVLGTEENPGPGIAQWFNIDISGFNVNNTLLQAVVTSAMDPSVTLCDNWILLTEPKYLELQPAYTQAVVGQANPDGSIDVHVTTKNIALFVTLTSPAQGYFSPNAMTVRPPGMTVQFIPMEGRPITPAELSFRVEDMSMYSRSWD